MKLFALVSLAMIAFAANSLLTRMALATGDMGPAAFGAVRLVSGAALLLVFAHLRGLALPNLTAGAWARAGMLGAYVLGFSYAYGTLETGIGALILFGGVQITIFGVTALRGEKIGMHGWIGASIAFAGLILLLLPGSAVQPDPMGTGLMIIAAIGWGLYTLAGRGSAMPLETTALSFFLAAPFAVALFAIAPDTLTVRGSILAVLSGAFTSGLGYALWYAVLPRLSAAVAGSAQLTVPVIAAAMGWALLSEPVPLQFVLCTILVLGGVLITLRAKTR